MYFLNHWEIDEVKNRYHKSGHSIMASATRLLSRFRDLINENSDGWAYWPKATKAAEPLMRLIKEQALAATEADYKKAVRPMKSFCTRHKLKFPDDRPDEVIAAELPPTGYELLEAAAHRTVEVLIHARVFTESKVKEAENILLFQGSSRAGEAQLQCAKNMLDEINTSQKELSDCLQRLALWRVDNGVLT